jgi:hypothetical protein
MNRASITCVRSPDISARNSIQSQFLRLNDMSTRWNGVFEKRGSNFSISCSAKFRATLFIALGD